MANANPPKRRRQQRGTLKPTPKPILSTDPPAPWRTHRDDFLAVQRTPEVTAREEQFEKQVKLLSEIITPIEYDEAITRHLDYNENGTQGKSTFSDYINNMHLYFLKDPTQKVVRFFDDDFEGPYFEVVGFQAEMEKRAFVRRSSSLEYFPFQGTGGFGLAIVASNIRRCDMEPTISKVALSQFLDVAPHDLEYIVITRASKFDFKRLAEVGELGIPIVFDMSGRTQSPKQVIDPLEGCIEKDRWDYNARFLGQLTESQAERFGEMSDAQKTSTMLHSLHKAANEQIASHSWPSEMISILSFDREEFTPDEDPEKTRVAATKKPSRMQRQMGERVWQQEYALFPLDCFPASENTMAIQRMHDVGCIWRKVLRDHGLTFAGPIGRYNTESYEKPVFDKEKIQEVGRFLGIDAMVESLYEGVPLDYII